MALDAAQARVMGKLMRDPSYMDDFWKDDTSGRCLEEGRTWDNFNDTYLEDDKYTFSPHSNHGKSRENKGRRK